MITTVGELRQAIEGVPDNVPIDLDVKMGYLYVDSIEGIDPIKHKGRVVCLMFRIEAYLNVERDDG